MEKELQHSFSNVRLENDSPGCMWSLFHIFDFHQRLHTKRALSDKKHGGGRHVGGNKIRREAGEELDSADGPFFLIEQSKKETRLTSKRSGKTRIKTLIDEEMSKEQDQKQQIPAFASRLLRTNSIHHMECSDYETDERISVFNGQNFQLPSNDTQINDCSTQVPILPEYPEEQVISSKQCEMYDTLNRLLEYSDPDQVDNLGCHLLEKQTLTQEKLDEAKEAFLRQQFMNGNEFPGDVSPHRQKEFLCALGIFNANQELFLKILQEPKLVVAKHVSGVHNQDAVLTKCGTFPATELSSRRTANLIKLKQKQKEIQSFTKQKGKSQVGNPTTTTTSPSIIDSSLIDHSDSSPLRTGESAEVGTISESLPDSPHDLKNIKQNGMVMSRFKGIKKRLKHVIKESKKERLRIAMDGILHRIPHGRKVSKNVMSDMDRDGRDSPQSGYNSDSATPTSAKGASTRVRRTPSLTDSLERYNQLLQSILSRETKNHLSEKLKLANEDSSVPSRPRTFQRIFSMPEFRYYFPGVDVDGMPHGTHTRTKSGVLVDGNLEFESYGSNNQKPVDAIINTDSCKLLASSAENISGENLVKSLIGSTDGDQKQLAYDIGGDLQDLIVGKNGDILSHEQESGTANNASSRPTQPSQVSVLGSCFPDGISNPAEVSVSEVDSSEAVPSVHLQGESSVEAPDSLETTGSIDEVQTPVKYLDSDSLHVRVDTKDEAEFNYVRDVLKKSGFSGEELLGTWHSPDQPVDPSLFDEVVCLTPKLNITAPEEGSNCDQQLLFDLINEILLEIHERSFTYCPWHLSIDPHIRPMPVGYHVLEEVWTSISWHLSSQPQLDPSLEYTVAQDFSKNDGWMHIRPEAECMGLELEDWIVDDLLDEVTLELAGA